MSNNTANDLSVFEDDAYAQTSSEEESEEEEEEEEEETQHVNASLEASDNAEQPKHSQGTIHPLDDYDLNAVSNDHNNESFSSETFITPDESELESHMKVAGMKTKGLYTTVASSETPGKIHRPGSSPLDVRIALSSSDDAEDGQHLYFDPYDASLDQDADLEGPRRSARHIRGLTPSFMERLRHQFPRVTHMRNLRACIMTSVIVLVIGAAIFMGFEEQKVYSESHHEAEGQNNSTSVKNSNANNEKEEPTNEDIFLDMPPQSSNTTMEQVVECQYSTLEELILHEMNFDPMDMSRSSISVEQKAYIWLTNLKDVPSLIRNCDTYNLVQKYVIAMLYYATDGYKWSIQIDFMSDFVEMCSWNTIENGTHVGLLCENENHTNYVTAIRLLDNELRGSIPTELGKLTFLEEINFDNNELEGTIPSELGNLQNLNTLMITKNFIGGGIPNELMGLSEMQFLGLRDNLLTGTIHTEIGQMTKLIELRLDGNMFDGTIPTEIGNLHDLSTFCTFYNNLVGTIPTEIGNLINARFLETDYNSLTGTIPTELSNMTELRELRLFENQLSGTIPTEIGNLDNLQRLELYENELTGTLPSELGKLSELQALYLFKNKLHGTIPTSYLRLRNLYDVDITWGNNITGDIGILCEVKYLIISIYCGVEEYTAAACECCQCWSERF